jgi:hypothetical protein
MSTHCLLCRHSDNWAPDEEGIPKEHDVDDKTWVVMRVHNDPFTKLPKKKISNDWYVHRTCMEMFLSEKAEDEITL